MQPASNFLLNIFWKKHFLETSLSPAPCWEILTSSLYVIRIHGPYHRHSRRMGGEEE
uniref:Uncharacterized protein n=1 Tax=Manihot esculenta TaxID=3983 RepID=A0A2C9WBR0_MANES